MKAKWSCGLGLLVTAACSASGHPGFEGTDAGGEVEDAASGDDQFAPNKNDSSTSFGDSSVKDSSIGGATTVYAHTDTTLYTLDPQSNALTRIGDFVGTSDAGNDSTITDLAVNSAGDVYVNSESVIYKATIPSSPGPVLLTKIAPIALQSGQKFYALAFTTAGALDTSEVLIGGDGFGELYSIDTTNGSTKDLGHFVSTRVITATTSRSRAISSFTMMRTVSPRGSRRCGRANRRRRRASRATIISRRST